VREPCAGQKEELKIGVEIGGSYDMDNILLHLHLLAKLHGNVNLSDLVLDNFHLISKKERALILLHL